MKLLREFVDIEKGYDYNNQTKEKEYYIEGIFMQGDILNKNGRIYPVQVLDTAVEKYAPKIRENDALGELNHPDSPTINFERASHKIVSLTKSGSNYIGKAKIMNTPMGKIVKALIEDNVRIGVSSRGLGSVKSIDGKTVVQNDFTIVTAADIVSEPSAPGAIVTALIESADWEFDGKSWIPKFKDESVNLFELRKTKEDKYIELFTNLMEKLSK